MASELRVNTLKDASGNNSVAMTYVAEGTAKSWGAQITTNGTAGDTFNISSITDLGSSKNTIALPKTLL